MDETAKQLMKTREGYERESVEGKFFLDAYAGTGGFRGDVLAPAASYWGWAADVYSASGTLAASRNTDAGHQSDSYLDRHDREDESQFRRRRKVAHYENHTAPAVDIPLSYIRRKTLTRSGDDALKTWMLETKWDELLMGQILTIGAVAGSCPVLFDMSSTDGDAPRTRADDIRDGRTVRAIPLFPANVLDYDVGDDGALLWIRLRFDRCDKDPFGLTADEHWTEIRVFTRTQYRTYRISDQGPTEILNDDDHDLGLVPVAVFRAKETVTKDAVRGISLIHDIATTQRRHFNLNSELDEHLRKCAFAFLQYPTRSETNNGAIVVGNGTALAVPPDSSQDIRWVSPEATVANVYETRIGNIEASIYAMARLQFARGQQVSAASSGLSKAYEFETTNRSIADIAKNLAEFDQDALKVVAAWQGQSADVSTTAPVNYDVEELDKELITLETCSRQRLGARTMTELRRQTARKLLPKADEATLAEIDEQIELESMSEMNATLQSDAATSFAMSAPVEPMVEDKPEDVEEVADDEPQDPAGPGQPE